MIACSEKCLYQAEGICQLDTTYQNTSNLDYQQFKASDKCLFLNPPQNNHLLPNDNYTRFYHYD